MSAAAVPDYNPIFDFTAPCYSLNAAAAGRPIGLAAPEDGSSRLLPPSSEVLGRVPNPDNLDGSFYPLRRLALYERGYDPSMYCVLGLDVLSGGGAKVFNVLRRDDVFHFVRSVATDRRNFYVLVDPDCPIDPFFDVDLNVDDNADYIQRFISKVGSAESEEYRHEAAQEIFLLELLQAVVEQLVKYFNARTSSDGTTSSSSIERLVVFSSSTGTKWSFHIHARMSEGKTFEDISEHKNFAQRLLATMNSISAVKFLDLSVYSTWRPFRLPLNAKRKDLTTNGAVLLPFEAPRLLHWIVDVTGQDIEEGPGPAGVVSPLMFELALIVRNDRYREGPAHTFQHTKFKPGRRLWPSPGEMQAVCEVFRELHEAYRSLTVRDCDIQYEDNNVFRSYYAKQKMCRYCVKLGREHKATYGQLFLTYQSIKYRCYSNDCHEGCKVLPWDTSRRLLELRPLLFPELPEAELFRRFGDILDPASSATALAGTAAAPES